MKTVNRILALFMCLVLISGVFTGCQSIQAMLDSIPDSTEETVNPGIDKVGYTLPYIRTDSLNPYECEDENNRNICNLLYDPLYSVSNDFKAVGVIADSSSFSENKKKLTVSIRAEAKFTDGSNVTASDVVYSFVLAKNNNYYSAYLKNISDASVSDASSVAFTLRTANEYEANNLIFPIIKKNSDKDNTHSDEYSSNLPIGSGRYTVKEENGIKTLAVNKIRLGSYHPEYNLIGLKDITEVSSIPNLFELNEIDFYTESFNDGAYKRYTGECATFETTNLTFLGINSNCSVLNESAVRRAIALLLNRPDLMSVSCAGFAVAAQTPFHPSFFGLEGCTLPPIKHDKQAAISLLEEAGYNIVSNYGIRYSPEKGKLELRLVVNKNNSFKLAMARSIQQALAEADITVVLKEYSYNGYINTVESGAWDLYIGETKLSNSFNLNVFFAQNGNVGYGIDPECETAESYRQFMNGDAKMQDFLDTFADELPFIPLGYRRGMTIRSTKIKTNVTSIINDYLSNIDEWTVE